jgi:phage-related protein
MQSGGVIPLEWVRSSKDDLREFPDEVQDHIGFALYQARAIYAVRFREAVYVLHAFQKRSKKGIATPKAEIDLAKRRLKAAQLHHAATYGKGSKR